MQELARFFHFIGNSYINQPRTDVKCPADVAQEPEGQVKSGSDG